MIRNVFSNLNVIDSIEKCHKPIPKAQMVNDLDIL